METIIEKFNVESEPPTDEDIKKTRGYIKRGLQLLLAIVIFLIITSVLVLVAKPPITTAHQNYPSVILFGIVMFIALGISYKECYKNKFGAGFIPKTVVFLEPVKEPSNIQEIVDMCKNNSVISTYQNKVAAQERALTVGEYEAMKNWMKKEAPKEELSNPIACEGGDQRV